MPSRGRRYVPRPQPYRGPPMYADDPLAVAIETALGGLGNIIQVKAERREREKEEAERKEQTRVQRETEEADRAFRREQFAYGQEQDALSRQERTDARRQDAVQRQDDLGVRFTGNMNFPLVKTGPSKRERDRIEAARVGELLGRADLIATADQLGIPNASQMENPQLRAMIEQAKGKAELKDFEARQQIQSRNRPPPDPSLAASRDALVEQREAMASQRRATDKSRLADKYIEATGGDANRAWRMMSESDAQAMGDFQMRPPDLLSAAQRYKDRRNPPARPSSGGSVMDDVNAELGRAEGPAPAGGSRPATDDDIMAAVRAVGDNEQKVREWLIARGINPDG